MKATRLLGLCFAATTIFLSCNTASNYDSIFSNFENIKKPALFLPELTLKGNTYKGCFSNDYSTFYFFRHNIPDHEDYRIFQSTFSVNKWSEPKEIIFSDSSSDLYPMTSTIEPDKLFFISYRRTPTDTSKKPNANFWYTTTANSDWQKPTPFEQTDLIYNYNSQPCITNTGNIYFTSDVPDWSKTLTYKMEYKDGTYEKPTLFDYVNHLRITDTTKTFWEICVSPNEEYIIMTISEKGKEAKLYLSTQNQETWSTPIYIGDIIKEDMSGNFPYITKDGKFLIFTREFRSFYIIPTKTFVKKNDT
jgi:hypothetical protein